MNKKKSEHWDRDLEVAVWYSYPHRAKPDTRGFPKTETGVKGGAGGAAGALRLINGGHASRIQCTHRPSGKVLWNALREKVPGSHIYAAKIIPGEFVFPVNRKEK